MDKLQAAKGKTKTSITQRVSVSTEKINKPIPAGAEIESKEIRSEIEQIENGWLLVETVETRYKTKGNEYTDWHYITKKTFSKTEPILTPPKGKDLADMF